MPQLQASKDRIGPKVMTAFEETPPKVISTTKEQDSDDDRSDKSHDMMKLEPLTIIWQNVLLFLFLHIAAVYGLCLGYFHAQWKSVIYGFVVGYSMSGLGVTAGAHRLWTHRSYKAKLPLRIFLAIGNATAWQKSIYNWVRDHRVHHKFPGTNADPTNVNRGFFFSHMGWLMVKKQADLIEKGNIVDCSDVWEDPVVRIQRRFYFPLAVIFGLVIPAIIPIYFWDEYWSVSVFTIVVLKDVLILNFTCLVNSASHIWGMKPYDKNITATENNLVSFVAVGEGFHNYHHTFPTDYATSELGYKYNLTTFFIDCMAYIGQAYDLKTTSPEIVHQRKLNTGDGSYFDEREKNE